jgi:uncharacterized protein YbcV (DUF1398 family)
LKERTLPVNAHQHDVAHATLEGSESGAITFPQSVQMLIEAGFEGYTVDFRGATRTYYLPTGETLVLPTPPAMKAVAARFDVSAIKTAIHEAQSLQPGYTYQGFCAKVNEAGCAGYMVAFLGKRVVYYGRTGETHVEVFPGASS